MIPLAHVGGLPLEEALPQLAPAALTAVLGLRLAGQRLRRWGMRVAGRRPRGCAR